MKKPILKKADQDVVQSLSGEELYANRHYMYAASCSQKQQLLGFQKFYEEEAQDELRHWTMLRDLANDYGFELEMFSTKAVEFESDKPQDVLSISYDLEFGLLEKYEKAYEQVDSISLKIDLQKFIEIQRKSVGQFADLIAEIESQGEVGVSFVNQRLLA